MELPRDERRERWQTLMKILRRNDVHRWRHEFLTTLEDGDARELADQRSRSSAGSDPVEPGPPAPGDSVA